LSLRGEPSEFDGLIFVSNEVGVEGKGGNGRLLYIIMISGSSGVYDLSVLDGETFVDDTSLPSSSGEGGVSRRHLSGGAVETSLQSLRQV